MSNFLCLERWSAVAEPVPRVHPVRAEELPALNAGL